MGGKKVDSSAAKIQIYDSLFPALKFVKLSASNINILDLNQELVYNPARCTHKSAKSFNK